MSLVLTGRHGPVATISLNRPERHNSLVPELLEQLRDAIAGAVADPEVRAIVLTAEGRSFSTGGDLAGFADHDAELERYADRLVGMLNDVIVTMLEAATPIVVAVHGIVTGGSLGLVLASDVVLVCPGASFTPWYGAVGFSPDGGWTAMLPRVFGWRRTTDVLLRNRTITADEAVAAGMATALVPAAALRGEALDVAVTIAGMAPGSIQATKALLQVDVLATAAALEEERRRFVAQVASPEARRGIERFLSRR